MIPGYGGYRPLYETEFVTRPNVPSRKYQDFAFPQSSLAAGSHYKTEYGSHMGDLSTGVVATVPSPGTERHERFLDRERNRGIAQQALEEADRLLQDKAPEERSVGVGDRTSATARARHWLAASEYYQQVQKAEGSGPEAKSQSSADGSSAAQPKRPTHFPLGSAASIPLQDFVDAYTSRPVGAGWKSMYNTEHKAWTHHQRAREERKAEDTRQVERWLSTPEVHPKTGQRLLRPRKLALYGIDGEDVPVAHLKAMGLSDEQVARAEAVKIQSSPKHSSYVRDFGRYGENPLTRAAGAEQRMLHTGVAVGDPGSQSDVVRQVATGCNTTTAPTIPEPSTTELNLGSAGTGGRVVHYGGFVPRADVNQNLSVGSNVPEFVSTGGSNQFREAQSAYNTKFLRGTSGAEDRNDRMPPVQLRSKFHAGTKEPILSTFSYNKIGYGGYKPRTGVNAPTRPKDPQASLQWKNLSLSLPLTSQRLGRAAKRQTE